MSTVSDRVKDIIAKHLGVDRDRVTEDANFIDDLGASSLDTIELAMRFEDELGCEIPEEVADSMFTAGDVIKFLETQSVRPRRCGNSQPAPRKSTKWRGRKPVRTTIK